MHTPRLPPPPPTANSRLTRPSKLSLAEVDVASLRRALVKANNDREELARTSAEQRKRYGTAPALTPKLGSSALTPTLGSSDIGEIHTEYIV